MFASTTDTQIMLSQKISIPPPPPQKGLEIPGRVGSQGPQNLKQCMKLSWNFQRGGVIGQTTSMGGVWIFSGTTHC